jgi:hypothetical protein
LITNVGKSILSKYLIGQAPAYASHISIGCGTEAKGPADVLDSDGYAEKLDMDFEMLRAPIISRGYVVEDGQSKIVFTAELPTQERYEITEVALYSAGANSYASGFDSRVLYYFSRQEPWKLGELPVTAIDTPLDAQNTENDIDQFVDISANPAQLVPIPKVFQTNASNKVFSNASRQSRNEQARFLNNMMMIRGDFSTTNVSDEIVPGENYISLSPISINLDKNAPTDKLKVAFSVINKEGNIIDEEAAKPGKVKILVEFVTNSGQTARFYATATSTVHGGHANFATNRYFVISTEIKDLIKSSGFAWSQVNAVRVYSVVLVPSNPGGTDFEKSANFYVSLDAIRLDNINSYNPLYGMTGYTVVKTPDKRPIIKLPNTSSLIEFRLAVGVQ